MKTPKFYFNLRSPYSWLACTDLVRDHPGLAARLEWIPYWEPDEHTMRLLTEAGGDFCYTTMPKAKHLYVLQDVRRLAAERNLTPVWPVDRDPHWEVPHLAWLVAAEHGRAREFVAATYRVRWQEGGNICDPATMRALAAELDLPADPLAGAADDPALREAGVRALLSAHADGVFGVPFFVAGFRKFWGVDRLPAFVRGLATPDVARREPAVPAGQAVNEGHAGGCG